MSIQIEGFLKFIMCLKILLLLKNAVDLFLTFADGMGGEVKNLLIFCGYHQ